MLTIDPIDYGAMSDVERDTICDWLRSNGMTLGDVCLLEFYPGGGARVTRFVVNGQGLPLKGKERYTTDLNTQPRLG